MKKSFVFYASFYEGIKELPNENQLRLYQAVVKFAITGEQPKNLSGIEKAVFALIKPQIEANNHRYENGCKGGAPKGNNNAKKTTETTKNNQKQPKVNLKNNQKQPNENENDNDNINENDKEEKEINKEKENNLPAQTAVPVSFELQSPEPSKPKPKGKPNTPQGKLCDYFKSRYKANTGIDYLATESDYSQLDKLIKQYGEQQVKQKIDWLEIGCTHPGVYWFTNDFSSFTIGKLRNKWNEILPVLTDEQRKAKAKRQHDEELIKRVEAELAKDAAYQKQKQGGNTNVIVPRNN